jgi:hypothetical protein
MAPKISLTRALLIAAAAVVVIVLLGLSAEVWLR